MKRLWAAGVKRLDALAQRERAAVFAAAALAILATLYVGGIEPAVERRKLIAARLADQGRLLAAAQAQQLELTRTLELDADAALRARVAEKHQQISSADAQLAELQRALVSPKRMPRVLQELVGNGRSVQLVSLRNLPAAPLVAEQGDRTAPQQHPGSLGAHVYRHGVEIVVQGSYLDLLAYVSRLEQQPWRVYWGKTILSAEYPKAVIALTLYTLSLDKAWLAV